VCSSERARAERSEADALPEQSKALQPAVLADFNAQTTLLNPAGNLGRNQLENEAEQSANLTDLKGVTEPVRHAFMAPATAWDAESAAEAGRRSGEVRRRKALMSPEDRAHDAIRGKMDKLVSELIHAALGEDDFEDLKLETRVTALQRLLEWELGRPAAVKPKEEAAPEAPLSGDGLFT